MNDTITPFQQARNEAEAVVAAVGESYRDAYDTWARWELVAVLEEAGLLNYARHLDAGRLVG